MTVTAISRLIKTPGEPTHYTDVQEVDARTALTRGLAEYLAQIRFHPAGGRFLQFQRVFSSWAQPEESAKYPSAIVYTAAAGVYDASRLTPSLPDARDKVEGSDNSFLVSASEFQQNLLAEVWATDPQERLSLVLGLESALNPVDWMYGFRLELPFYFNQRATFALVDMAYQDSEENAMRRYRKAVFTLSATIPVCNVFTYPQAKPRFHLDAIGPDVVIPGLVLTDC